MRIPKRYGESRIDKCPFCESTATTESSEGIPVCSKHKNMKLPPLKCICGEYLEVKKGKWGAYFNCIICGNVSFSKAMEVNPDFDKKENKVNKQEKEKQTYKAVNKTKKEITLTSDELDFY